MQQSSLNIKRALPLIIDKMLSLSSYPSTDVDGNKFRLDKITNITIDVDNLSITGNDLAGMERTFILAKNIQSKIVDVPQVLNKIPLLKYVPEIKIEGVSTPGFIGCSHSQVKDQYVLERRVFLDPTSPYLQLCAEKFKKGEYSKQIYEEILATYSYRVNFRNDRGVQELYLAYRGVLEAIDDRITNRYYIPSTKNYLLPCPPITTQEQNATRNITKPLAIQDFNIKVSTTFVGHSKELTKISIYGLVKQSLRTANTKVEKGLYVFKNTNVQEVFDLFYKNVDKPIIVVYFTLEKLNISAIDLVIDANVNIVQPIIPPSSTLNSTATSESYENVIDRCKKISSIADLIIVPNEVHIEYEDIINLSNRTKVVLLRDYITIRDFIENHSHTKTKRVIDVLEGLGDVNQSQYLNGDLVRQLADKSNVFDYIDESDTISMLNQSLKTKSSIAFNDFIKYIETSNNGKEISEIIIDSSPAKVDETGKLLPQNSVTIKSGGDLQYSNVQPISIDNKKIMRIFLEYSQSGDLLKSLKNLNRVRFKVENSSRPFHMTVINDNGILKIHIVYLTSCNITPSFTNCINFYSSSSRSLRLSAVHTILQGLKNQSVLIVDLNKSIITSTLNGRGNRVSVVSDLENALYVLGREHYDVVIINSLELLTQKGMNVLMSNINYKTKYILLSKYYLPEIIYRYVEEDNDGEIRLFLRYLGSTTILYKNEDHIISTAIHKQHLINKMESVVKQGKMEVITHLNDLIKENINIHEPYILEEILFTV